MDHPSIAEAGERLIDAEGHHFALLVGAAGVIVARVEPSGHEGAVFADNHAVIHHGGVVEQIGHSGVF